MLTLMRLALLSMACVVAALAGCSRETEKRQFPPRETATETSAMETKMRLVVQEAIRQAQDPANKAAFEAGKIYVTVEGLDMPVVGVSLPVDNTGKQVRVSFTDDYFKATPVTQLARHAL